MTLIEQAMRAAERRLARIEAAYRAIAGVTVERRGLRLTVRGGGLARRWREEPALRFAGQAR